MTSGNEAALATASTSATAGASAASAGSAASKLDQSLGAIIEASSSHSRRGGRNGRNVGRNGGGNGSRRNGGVSRRTPSHGGRMNSAPYTRPAQRFDNNAIWRHDRYAANATGPVPPPAQKVVGDTIHISNLAADVNADDLRDIFSKIGHIVNAVVHYNQHGTSLGTAELTFADRSLAQQAVDEYDGAEVDGRAIYIKLVGTVVATRSVVPRTAQPAYAHPSNTHTRAAHQSASSRAPRQSQRRSGAGVNGGGRSAGPRANAGSSTRSNGRNGGGRGGMKKPATAGDLDAELEAYQSSRGVAGSAGEGAADNVTSGADASSGQPEATA